MAQVHGERTEKLQFNFPPAEFAATAMKRFGEFTKVQTEQLSNFQETNRQWLERTSGGQFGIRTYLEARSSPFDP